MNTRKTISLRELIEMARDWGLSGYTGLKKSELAKLLAGGLKSKTVMELSTLAKDWGLSGLSGLRKKQMIKKLRASLVTFGAHKKKPSPKKKTVAKARPKKAAPKKAQPRKALPKKAAKARQRPARKTPARALAPKKKRPAASAGRGPARSPEHAELPENYSDGRMVLLPRDPDWLYCYWDPTPEQQERLEDDRGMPAIRVVDVGCEHKILIQPVSVSHSARSWYFQVTRPKGTYRAELGLLNSDGIFEPIMSSNSSSLPPSRVADKLSASLNSNTGGGQHKTAGRTFEPDEGLADKLQALSTGVAGPGIDSARALESRRWLEEVGSSSVSAKVKD